MVEYLKSKGHDIKVVVRGSSDESVIKQAKREKRALPTNDSDFSMTLKFPSNEYYGILIFRIHPPSFKNYRLAIDQFLAVRAIQKIKKKTFIIDQASFLEIQ